ncbi:MAG: fibronectin type III domain-containing protein [Ruminococcaceae bacterium]|nr:fibronectin type III domain-containing protein [Oscillospiraceae bacterium]
MKKALSILLSVIMLLSVFSGFSINAFALESEGICGSKATYTFDSKTGTLTIKGEGKVCDRECDVWDGEWFVESPFRENKKIKKLVISEGITGFGAVSFYNCTSLKSISFPKSFSEPHSISPQMFEGCDSLVSIKVASGNKYMDSRENCNAVISKKFSQMELACSKTVIPDSVKRIGYGVFSNIKNLKKIYIPASVNLIYDYISNCPNLESIVVDENNEKYSSGNNCNALLSKDGRYLYSGCKNTVIPEGVVDMDENAFYNCKGLKSINLPASFGDFEYDEEYDYPEDLKAYTFKGCTSLESISVDENNKKYDSRNNCNAIIKTETNELILGCENTVIPETVTRLGFGAFSGEMVCDNLTEISIPDSVEYIGGNAFSYCKKLKNIKLPEGLKSLDWGVFENCTSLESVNIPKNITALNSSLFRYCTSLKSIELPEGLKTIGWNAFDNCTSLESIYIPKKVSEIKYNAFIGCSGLKEMKVDPENKTFDSRNGCNAIISTKYNSLKFGCKKSVIPNNVIKISQYAFYGNTALKSIKIPSSVKTIDGASFAYCTGLKEITLPIGIKNLRRAAFYYSGLTSITIPESVKQLDSNVFQGCKNLKTIKVSSKNKTFDSRDKCNAVIETKTNKLILGCKATVIPKSVKTIGGNAFAYCSGLKRIDIPSGVTKIESAAFDHCTNLKYVSLNKSVKTIETDAFLRCDSLICVYYSGSQSQWKKIKIATVYTDPDGYGDYSTNSAIQRAVKFYNSSPIKLSSVKNGKKSFTTKWKKISSAKGYQIQYSTSSDFKNAKTVTVKGNKTFTKTVKNLKSGKKYYVRVRAYKIKNSAKHFGAWSEYKTVKTK